MKAKMKEVRELLDEVKADEYRKWADEWQGRAVAVLNEIYFDADRYDDEIYDTGSDIWDDLVARELESRGWVGVLFFLEGVGKTADFARLDGYGNGEEITGDDLAGLLADELAEMERENGEGD